MKKLIEQLVKFGLVGVISFVIDEAILNLLLAFHFHNVVASTISFLISLIFNYLASMKYVFKHRDDMARWMEMLIFLVASVIGLFINAGIIWLSTFGMNRDAMVSQHGEYMLRTNIGKIIATVIVAIWNFVIRKWLLDSTETIARNQMVAGGDSLHAADGNGSAAVSGTPGSGGPTAAVSGVSDFGSPASGSDRLVDSPRTGDVAKTAARPEHETFAYKLGMWSIRHTPKGWK